MANVNGIYTKEDARTTVTWANVSSADTTTSHTITGKPELLSIQVEGNFSGGTNVSLLGSISGSSYVNTKGLTGNVIAITSNSIVSVLESVKFIKPVVSSGSSDSVTITGIYWTR